MKSWLLSIVGVVFLSVLFDLIYPNGKINRLCKSIFGIFAVFVMISPLLKINIDDYVVNLSDDTMLNNIAEAKDNSNKIKIESYLSDCNIVGVDVEIESNITDGEYIIENIYVDTSNLVLSEIITNINKYEVIASKIASVISIEPERIVVYG